MKRDHPLVHAITYSPTGFGKSTFLTTWPKPLLVLLFDPPDKAGPYRRDAALHDSIKKLKGPFGLVERINCADGLTQVEHFHDTALMASDPKLRTATAFPNFRARLDVLYGEYKNWATVAVDSVTYLAIAARKYEQYVLNPSAKDPRKWHAGAADNLEEILMIGLASLRTNVVLLVHLRTYHDEDGGTTTQMTLPGRLGDAGSGLPIGYGELYRLYKKWSEKKGKFIRRLQTDGDDEHHASSQIGAPNNCLATYGALWPKE